MRNITLANTWSHFKKICVHKYWVAHYCFKVGLYKQGILHDMSKFSPTEFWESVRYYKGTSSPINEAKADMGYSMAWQHHKGRNPHHYEYWTDNYDKGTTCICMPYEYAAELVCDWLGAARAYMGDKFTYEDELKWWKTKRASMPKMHEHILNFVDIVFNRLFDGHFDDLHLRYYYKIAQWGDYQYWLDFDKKHIEEALDETAKRGYRVHYIPTFEAVKKEE